MNIYRLMLYCALPLLTCAVAAMAEEHVIGDWNVKTGIAWHTMGHEGRTGYLGVRHKNLPDQQFVLRMPEYANLYKSLLMIPSHWRRVGDRELEMVWDAPPAVQEEHQVARAARFVFGSDYIDVYATVRNPTDRRWPHDRYDMYDVMTRNAPLFRDDKGDRTLVYRTDRFVPVKDFPIEGIARDLTGSLSITEDIHKPGQMQITERIMAKVSRDRNWVLAIASDAATGVSFNLNPGTGCIHQNPSWGRLKPGEQKDIHCRVYLIRGALDALWQRYLKDFADTALHAQSEHEQLMIDGALISTGKRIGEGDLVQPWAHATDLRTFAEAARNRPTGCENDALLCWVADQRIRDGESPTLNVLKAERGAFQRRKRFALREDDTGLWIANQKVGLRFTAGRSRYDLLSFYDLAHRIEMIGRRPTNGSPVRCLVLRYRPDGTTGVLNFGPQWRKQSPDPSMAVEIDTSTAASASHDLSVTDSRLLLTLKWAGIHAPDSPGQLNVTATVELKAGDPLTRWRASVNGQLPRAGIAKVRCPVLAGLGYPGEVDVCYAWGAQRGVMRRSATTAIRGTYPSSQWSLQHFSVSFGPRAVLYAACHDPSSHVKSFYVKPADALYLSADVPNTGVRENARYDQPYDVVIGPMDGDWFDAARRYRQWALANAPWAARPLRDRDDVSHRMLEVAYWIRCNWIRDNSRGDESWAFDQAMMRLPVHETVEWYRRALAVPDDRLGAIHYGWQTAVWDTRLPYWTPFGPSIAEELRRQTGLGISTYIYTNPCWFDPQTPGFNDAAKAAITRNIDGSMYSEKYNAKMYEISRATPAFSRVLVELAKMARKMGSNGVYYDQFSGLLRGGDYDRSKGLPSFGRGGNWLPLARQQAMRNARKTMGGDFGFTSEFYCETNQRLFDVQSVTIHCDPLEAPLIPAIYSGYIVQHGAGLHHETRPAAAIVSLGRNFLWGTAFGWTQFAAELRRNYTRVLLRQLVQLRIQLDDFVIYGQMVRPPAFSSPPRIKLDRWHVYGQDRAVRSCDAYEATLWQSNDGRLALLAMNFDEESHRLSFSLDGDLAGAHHAEVLEPAKGARAALEAGQLLATVPGRCAAAIILIKDHSDVAPTND